MTPRILLFTGKGGVGKTTAAAGAATLAARAGRRTLVMSTDAAHSLGDAFGLPDDPSGKPVLVEPDLHLLQIDTQALFERSWTAVQRYLLTVLDAAGVDPITAEELTVVPGADEVMALLEVRHQANSAAWDLIVVDCAPTAETLRLLALPEALGWYMARVFPTERRVIKALRPVLSRAAGVPMPGDSVFDAIERLHGELAEVQELLSGATASVRLVLTPETVVVAEARRSLTTLSLFGYRVDGVVANRVFPAGEGDSWRQGWVAAQSAVLADVADSFAGLPVWQAPYLAAEPVGADAVAALAAGVYDDKSGCDPWALPVGPGPLQVTRTDDGTVLRLELPFAGREDVRLARHGQELVVTVGSYRRVLALPTALARLEVAGARVDGGALQVRFQGTTEPPTGTPTERTP